MALRLAGEQCSVVRGLDDLGWVKEITRTTSDYALKITQNGSGVGLQLEGSTKIKAGNSYLDLGESSTVYGYSSASVIGAGGNVLLIPAAGYYVDIRERIQNSTANNSGDVLVDDDLAVASGKKLRLEGAGSDSYFVFQNNRIEVFINGVLEGYIDTTGFVST